MDVVIGVDAHKSTHTLVAVDGLGRKIAARSFSTTSAAHGKAIKWARTHAHRELVWGVEDCQAMTARLESDLLAAGQRVIRVPPHLIAGGDHVARWLALR